MSTDTRFLAVKRDARARLVITSGLYESRAFVERLCDGTTSSVYELLPVEHSDLLRDLVRAEHLARSDEAWRGDRNALALAIKDAHDALLAVATHWGEQ